MSPRRAVRPAGPATTSGAARDIVLSRELGFRLEIHLRGHMRSLELGRTRGQVVVLQRWTRGQVVVHQRARVHVGLDLLMFE